MNSVTLNSWRGQKQQVKYVPTYVDKFHKRSNTRHKRIAGALAGDERANRRHETMMYQPIEKRFAVSFVVSCKKTRCVPEEGKCERCLAAFIGRSVRSFDNFKTSGITTGNGSRQFGVSFMATCKKPDCTVEVPRAVACCTASADKCEMCLSSIVGRSIRQMHGFHMKEIAVV